MEWFWSCGSRAFCTTPGKAKIRTAFLDHYADILACQNERKHLQRGAQLQFLLEYLAKQTIRSTSKNSHIPPKSACCRSESRATDPSNRWLSFRMGELLRYDLTERDFVTAEQEFVSSHMQRKIYTIPRHLGTYRASKRTGVTSPRFACGRSDRTLHRRGLR